MNKLFLCLLFALLLLFGCEDKNQLTHIVAGNIFINENNPDRHQDALEYLNANRSKSKDKYRDERDELIRKILDSYAIEATEAFLLQYGKTKVVFMEGYNKLYIKNLDGTEQELIFSDEKNTRYMSFDNIRWSPDGEYIICNPSSHPSNLLLIEVKTKKASWLTDRNDDFWPNWSPDSKKVIFYRETGNQIISIDIKTKKEELLYEDWEYPPICPFYLPNGEDIAFNRNLQLQVLKKGDSIPRLFIETVSKKDAITISSALSGGAFEYGSISKSGKYMLVHSNRPNVYDMSGKLVSELYGLFGTWSYDDEYIMFQTSDDEGEKGFGVSPVFPETNIPVKSLFIGYGREAAWCPMPPSQE